MSCDGASPFLHRGSAPSRASSQQQVARNQLCSSDNKFNFLLIANMQQCDLAQETGLQSRRHQPTALAKVHVKITFQLSNFHVQKLKEKFQLWLQDTVRLSTSTIPVNTRFLLDLATKDFGESQPFSSCKALRNFQQCKGLGHFVCPIHDK